MSHYIPSLFLIPDVKLGKYSDKNKAVMGFLEPHYFSFHSSDISTRHQLLANISNRFIFITFLAVALFSTSVLTVEPLLQQQSEQHDADNQLSSCETKALDDVPPDPVR
jgi:hypothetical protein